MKKSIVLPIVLLVFQWIFALLFFVAAFSNMGWYDTGETVFIFIVALIPFLTGLYLLIDVIKTNKYNNSLIAPPPQMGFQGTSSPYNSYPSPVSPYPYSQQSAPYQQHPVQQPPTIPNPNPYSYQNPVQPPTAPQSYPTQENTYPQNNLPPQG